MNGPKPASSPPNSATARKDRLFGIAAAQEGLFTAQQAQEAGYSDQLLVHHVRSGNFRRVHRGVYRLVHYPPGDHEELVEVWLWSDRVGVFSHETALALQTCPMCCRRRSTSRCRVNHESDDFAYPWA